MDKCINIIAAIDKNKGLGYKGDLLCHLKDDLKYFKSVTLNNTVIMGRKTFESFPNGALKNRENIVITRNKNWCSDNVITAFSIEDAIEKATNMNIFIIGGGEIYNQSLKYADKLYLTEIDHEFENVDTYFPDLPDNIKLEKDVFHPKDTIHPYSFHFKIYKI